ncbi:MAG: serine hydrolase [Thermovirgaceae bacterium]|nr:serine hydrolase [Synergistales bacterium]MDI9393655.1 serine hydrolase [Synergistota bacterium]MDY0178787.1 serine hydrolase [Synergistaceae bacterium]HRW87300.1 serine hydrolase [Thermovirgaceae bacterium]MDD3830611.1 serine hydrolase [Synergistales bacterium]
MGNIRYALKGRVRLVFLAIVLVPLLFTGLEAQALARQERPSDPELEVIFRDLESRIARTLQSFQIPGMAVAVVQGGELIYQKGFGVKKLGGVDPVTTRTVFQIGSTSKAFTATLVASVVEEGKVGWKDRVIMHLPYFAMADPWVTEEFQVRDLMAQHSGMKPYAGDFLAMIGFDRDYIVRSTANIPPVYSFRSEFSYVNNLWVTAAAVVEAKTGLSWGQNLKKRILDPLGMSATTCSMAELLLTADRSTFHLLEEGKVKAIPEDWFLFNWPYVYGPAGGINSNIIDMSKWMIFQLGEGTYQGTKIMEQENLLATHVPQTPIGSGRNSYCMGWLKSEYHPYPLIWHNGATSGSGTLVMLVPELDLGIVILSNLVTPATDALGLTFVDLYCGNPSPGEHLGKALEGWQEQLKSSAEGIKPPKNAHPPLPFAAYAGVYESPLVGKVRVMQHQGRFFLRMGPRGVDADLRHWNRDTFICEMEGLDEGPLGMVRFELDPEGKAFAFVITDEDGDLVSRFERESVD